MDTVWSFSGATDNLAAVARACSAAGFAIVPAGAVQPHPHHRTAAPRRGRERPPGDDDDALLTGGRLVGMADLSSTFAMPSFSGSTW